LTSTDLDKKLSLLSLKLDDLVFDLRNDTTSIFRTMLVGSESISQALLLGEANKLANISLQLLRDLTSLALQLNELNGLRRLKVIANSYLMTLAPRCGRLCPRLPKV